MTQALPNPLPNPFSGPLSGPLPGPLSGQLAGNPAGDPLAQLKPIHLPADPSWWPPAPGWWLLAAGILIAGLGLIYWLRRRQLRKAPLRAALAALDTLAPDQSSQEHLLELNHILRRAARHSHGPGMAAQGPRHWAEFLKQTAPPDLNTAHWHTISQTLSHAAYQIHGPERTGDFVAFTRAWLRHNLS